MFDQIESTVLSFLQAIFDQFGWAGVFGLMVFENATSITPAEVILAFAGWMLIEKQDISPAFIPIAGVYAGLGSAIGASIMYWMAYFGGRPVIDKFAKFFRIDLAMIAKAETEMHKWGAGLVLIGRVIPGIRTFINIPAGLARFPFLRFFIATFIGAYIWCTLLIGAGYVLGHEWKLISEYIKMHLPLVFTLAASGITAFLAYHYRERIPVLAKVATQLKRIK